MSQAASCQFLAVEFRIRFQDSLYEVCAIISGTELNTSTISPNLLQNILNIEAWRLCRKPPVCLLKNPKSAHHRIAYMLFYHGATAQVGQGLLTGDALQSHSRHSTVGRNHLDEWLARSRHLRLMKHNIHNRHPSPGGIQTHNPKKRAAAGPLFRPRDHWDRSLCLFIY
jgi:hypothetical protein